MSQLSIMQYTHVCAHTPPTCTYTGDFLFSLYTDQMDTGFIQTDNDTDDTTGTRVTHIHTDYVLSHSQRSDKEYPAMHQT